MPCISRTKLGVGLLPTLLIILIILIIQIIQIALPALADAADITDARATGSPEDEKEVEEIIVTESRYNADEALNLTNVTREDLELRQPDQTIPLLLQDLPGVFSYSDAGSNLGYTYVKIRGFDQRRVGVLVNGIPLNDPEDHQLWWVDMPDLAESLQDIQVQRGVTNSMGGLTAMGGTINIVTRPLGAESGGRATLAAGSYGFGRQMVSYETGELDGGFRSGLRLSRQDSDGYRDRTGVEQWGLFWTGEHHGEKMTTTMNIYTGREVTQHAWNATPESILENDRTYNPETYHNAVDDFTQPHYELHNDIYLSDAVTLRSGLYYIQGEGFYENFKDGQRAADFALDRALDLAPDAEVDLIRRKYVRKDHVGWVPRLLVEHDGGRLVVGGDIYTFHSNHWGEVMGVEGFAPWDLADPQHKYHEYTGDKDAYSFYVNERYRVSDNLTLMADLQYQHKTYDFMQREVGNFRGLDRHAYTVEYDFFNPKGGARWQPGRLFGGEVAVFGSIGVNHREPTDNELFDTWMDATDLGVSPLFGSSRVVYRADGVTPDYVEWSDPQVQEEKVIDYELGFSWAGENLSFTLGGYYMDFRDEIVPYGGTNDEGYGIRGNAGQTLHRGLELGLRTRIDGRNELLVAASRSWDEFEEFHFYDWDGSLADLSGNPIALFPEYLASVAWRTRWNDGVQSEFRVRTSGKQYLDNTGDEDRTIDSWATLDFSIWADLDRLGLGDLSNARAFLHLRNLGDAEYETWGYYYGENHLIPAADRNMMLGVDYDF